MRGGDDMEKKFHCFSCKFKGNVPGSAHICCNHPSLKKIKDNPTLKLAGMFASVKRGPPMVFSSMELNIRGNPHGIKNGWFNFPFNFDPTWLENCDGYEEKGGD